MLKIKPLLIAVFVMLSLNCFCQCPFNTNFGEIKTEDFTVKSDLIDSSANAIILFDIGTCEIEATSLGMSNPVYTRHTRIKILNKNGYNLATIKNMTIDRSGVLVEIKHIKASTYNLENNNILESKLDKKDILESKVIKGVKEDVFTLPAVKEGSIIEYSYTLITSGTVELNSWIFEKKQPCIYSEYTSTIPTKYNYHINITGDLKIDSVYKRTPTTLMLHGSLWKGFIVNSKWSANNIAAVKEEPYLTSLNNYISRIEFKYHDIFSGWGSIFIGLKKNKYFGVQIDADNEWLNKPIQDILDKNKDTIKAVYEYVRDSITRLNTRGLFITYNSTLEDVYNNKKGSSTDINMLMIAMLKKLHIDACPVILSTRENGFVNTDVSILTDYNYLIVGVIDRDSTIYYLDASKACLGFKKLPLNCYNGNVIVLGNKPTQLNLTTDSLKENENSFVYISNNEDGSLTATCKETLGYYHSLKFREELINKSLENIAEKIQKSYPDSNKIKELSIDSLRIYDNPIGLNYYIDYHFTDDVVYFNPMMNQAITENPFKSVTRKLPVEKSYTEQLVYSFTMEVPKGYTIDEIPKSANVLLNEDEGLFEYKISVADNLIQLRCKLKFNKANFNSDDYQPLRDFYGVVVKKMSEQIVFKKIK